MTREQMRDLLRRRLQEPSVEDFSDAQLNDLLNQGLGRLQTRIMAYDPSAFMAIDRKDLTAGQKLYLNPSDYFFTYFVETMDPGTGSYVVLRPMTFVNTLVQTPGALPVTEGLQRYARFGRKYLALFPVPTANVADGLQHTYCPTLLMADDESVPDLPPPLHIAAVIRAQLYAMSETNDDTKTAIAELNAIESEIPSWYQRSGDIPDTLPIDLGKDRIDAAGQYYWRNVGNGIDIR